MPTLGDALLLGCQLILAFFAAAFLWGVITGVCDQVRQEGFAAALGLLFLLLFGAAIGLVALFVPIIMIAH